MRVFEGVCAGSDGGEAAEGVVGIRNGVPLRSSRLPVYGFRFENRMPGGTAETVIVSGDGYAVLDFVGKVAGHVVSIQVGGNAVNTLRK